MMTQNDFAKFDTFVVQAVHNLYKTGCDRHVPYAEIKKLRNKFYKKIGNKFKVQEFVGYKTGTPQSFDEMVFNPMMNYIVPRLNKKYGVEIEVPQCNR